MQVAPTPDRTPPDVRTLFGSRISKRALIGRKRLKASCSEACSLTLELRLNRKTARKLKLGRLKGLLVARGRAAVDRSGNKTTISRGFRLVR